MNFIYLYNKTTRVSEIHTIYNAVNRAAWAVCVCWVIVACTCGYGGKKTAIVNQSYND